MIFSIESSITSTWAHLFGEIDGFDWITTRVALSTQITQYFSPSPRRVAASSANNWSEFRMHELIIEPHERRSMNTIWNHKKSSCSMASHWFYSDYDVMQYVIEIPELYSFTFVLNITWSAVFLSFYTNEKCSYLHSNFAAHEQTNTQEKHVHFLHNYVIESLGVYSPVCNQNNFAFCSEKQL